MQQHQKIRFALWLCLCLPLWAAAQPKPDNEVPVQAPIKRVTVFTQQAQIGRTADVQVPAGKSLVVFQGLAASLVKESVQAEGQGQGTILGVSHRRNYLYEAEVIPQAQALGDSIAFYSDRIALEENKINTVSETMELLKQNRAIGGANNGVAVDELQQMVSYYRQQMEALFSEQLALKRNLAALQKRREQLYSQLNQVQTKARAWVSEVVVAVETQQATRLSLNVNYLVQDAGWQASYDLRAPEALDGPLALDYRAKVANRTGVDWEAVQLTLSTNAPALSGSRPVLAPLYAQIYEPRRYQQQQAQKALQTRNYAGRAKKQEQAMEMEEDAGFGGDYAAASPAMAEMETTADLTTSEETALALEFSISEPYTIPSSEELKTVPVKSVEMKADYQHYVVPVQDETAYLVAFIPDWEQYELFPGAMNVYFGNTFVGQSEINPAAIADTLEISLGRDQNVVVELKELQDANRRQFIGSNKKETHTFQIAVRNAKQTAVRLRVEGQIPVSEDDRITVELEECGAAQYTAGSGKLVWNLSLQPGSSDKLRYRYEIKYPKSQRVRYYRRGESNF